jgi:hypothetical protein
MRTIHYFLSAALLLTLGAGSASTLTYAAQYTNPKLTSGEVTVTRVCVMPAAAELNRVGMKGKESMTQESDTWSVELQKVVETHLKEIGVTITSTGMSSEDLEKNDRLRQTVLQIQQKYDSVSTQMTQKPKDIKKGRYTLGDEVALLPCSANSDAVVFVKGVGSVVTGGKKAFGILVGPVFAGQSTSMGALRITFADAKSGEILAYTGLANDGKRFEADPEAAYGKKLGKELQKIGIGPKQAPQPTATK